MRRDYGYFEEDQLGKPYDFRLLKRLFPFIKSFRMLFAASVILVSVVTVLDLALPYLMKVAIDRYIVRSESSRGDGPSASPYRLYRADLDTPEVEAVVARYPGLFEVEGKNATIRYEKLAKLDKGDLAILRRGDGAGVATIALVFLGVVICHFFFSFCNLLILEYAGQAIMHDLRLRLFKHIQGLSVRFHAKNPLGRLVTRVTSDVQNMHEFFTSIITVLFKDVFLLVGITLVLVAMNWKLAMVCFVMLPVVFFITVRFSRMARDVFRDLRTKVAQINSKIQESIDGIRIIQLFSQEDKNYKRFKQLNYDNYLAGMRQVNIFAVFMPTIEILSAVTTALVIWYGGLRVLDETVTLGVLVAFVSYMKMFFRPIRDMAEKYNVMQSAMASCERIFLLFDTQDKIPEPDGRRKSIGGESRGKEKRVPEKRVASPQGERGRTAVHFDSVWFAYERDDWVIKNFSLTVKKGETVAIVGPTGAGKSTLIHLLERFYDPVRGAVRLGQVDLRHLTEEEVRAKMALISQDVFLFADTVRSNITAGNPPISEDRLEAIIAGCNLNRVIDRLPQGVDTELTEGGSTLSSGERQLIAFARALARDPDILILDEATSSIDSETEKLIQEATFRLMEGRTAIVVAHRLSTIRHADRIVVLHRGKVKEVGSHDALMEQKGFYYKLYQWQAIA